jgi:hypothetical protein
MQTRHRHNYYFNTCLTLTIAVHSIHFHLLDNHFFHWACLHPPTLDGLRQPLHPCLLCWLHPALALAIVDSTVAAWDGRGFLSRATIHRPWPHILRYVEGLVRLRARAGPAMNARRFLFDVSPVPSVNLELDEDTTWMMISQRWLWLNTANYNAAKQAKATKYEEYMHMAMI